jgi:TRAP-type uncharacterized transport system fused permease subunit
MPFFFVVNPALVGRGPVGEILVCLATGLVGAVLLAAGFFGYLRSRLSLVLRGWFILGGLLLLAPSRTLSLFGFGLSLGGLMAEGLLMRRRAQIAPADRTPDGND